VVARGRDRRRDRHRMCVLTAARAAPQPGPRAGRDAGRLEPEPRGGVRRERRRHLRRRAVRRGARLPRARLLAARALRAWTAISSSASPSARARLVEALPVPRRVRRRARLSAQPGRQRLPRHDRPRALQRDRARRCRFRQTAAGEYSPRMRWGLVAACTSERAADPGRRRRRGRRRCA
jgi:hypothetical protein